MMKSIAVLTDIHGNSPALQAVMNDIKKMNIEHIYCLGDVVGIGPDSNRVLDLLISRNDVSFIVGNHDLAVIAAFRNDDPPHGHHNERIHHKWLAERIHPAYIELMSNWPMKISDIILSKNLFFGHYHLDQANWFTSIDKFPSIEKLDHIYSGTDYHLVCFGHHHIVHHFVSPSRIYLNPGSLGCYDKPLARYGVIHISEDDIIVELREVAYNNVEFLRSYEDLKVPDREFILKVFHGGQ